MPFRDPDRRRDYHRKYDREVQYIKSRPEKLAKERARHLKEAYGITPEEFDRMYEAQHGLCAICGKPETHKTPRGFVYKMSVDHDHNTGKVRALLCRSCNSGIGKLGDSSELAFRAALYLASHGV